MEDIDQIPGLICTLCFHDLNHRSYKVCEHPILPVPLCILCNDTAKEIFDKEYDSSEICNWCGDGGDMLICSKVSITGVECGRAFCRDCISNNLGPLKLEAIDQSDDWFCLLCDPAQLQIFANVVDNAQANSIFADDDASNSQSEHSEAQLAINRLTDVVAEGKFAVEHLEADHLEEKRGEFRIEFLDEDQAQELNRDVDR